MIDEQRYRELIQQLATGGITGNKTYHQYRDQYIPRDSESMDYAHGGGVGSMMKAKRGLVNEPGGYAGYEGNYYGGGADYMRPLGYVEDETIDVEDLTLPKRTGNFKISAAKPLNDQSGTIAAAPNIMENAGVQSIEGSLINDDFRNDRIRSMVPPNGRFSEFDKARMGAPANTSLGYRDKIRDMVPAGYENMNALEKDIANVAYNTSQKEFDSLDDGAAYEEIPGFNFKDAPTSLSSRFKNPEFLDNPNRGWWDSGVVSRGNPEKSLVNKVKGGFNKFGNWAKGIMDNTMVGKFAAMNDATNPNAANYNPKLESQIDFLEKNNMYGKNTASGLPQIQGGVLAGKNLQSLFGTNDYLGMLEKKQDYFEKRIKANKKYNKDTYASTLAEIEKEKQRQAIETQKAIEAEKAQAKSYNIGPRGGGAGDSSRGHMGGISQAQADAVGAANAAAGYGGWGLADGGIINLIKR